jgi:site-specific recombinase XerD
MDANPVYKLTMDDHSSWLHQPAQSYLQWQENEAAGADRKPFSQRSIVQHRAMFDRFLRHLTVHQVNVATFSADTLESFFADVDNRCAPGTTTRLRYVKLLDRLCRHLVEIGLREANPAFEYARAPAWPEDEPEPLFLGAEHDARLQAYVQPDAADEPRDTRNRAIVALLLGTGVTSAEVRSAKTGCLVTDGPRPELVVPKRGPRDERRIPLPAFALAPLAAYHALLPIQAQPDALLFPMPVAGKAMSDMMLIKIVRSALESIDFRAPDMSPRVLRNTYARRLLTAGRTNEDVSRLLGLVSQRTVMRLRATISPAKQAPADKQI